MSRDYRYHGSNPFADLKIRVINLNTVHKPTPGFRDETPRIWCGQCKNWLNLGCGMDEDRTMRVIADVHRAICEGDAAITLMRIEQMWKAA